MRATRRMTAALGCALGFLGCASPEPSFDTPAEPARVYALAGSASAEPLPGQRAIWQYTEIAGTRCRDGSPAGVATNFSGRSDKLMIYLEGGGWCFDEASCAANPARASDYIDSLGITVGVAGWFDRTAADNPLRDYNFVYIPYCTGDLWSGANPFGDVPGVGAQRFVGYSNMQQFLPRIHATFPDAQSVLLAGGSAGGIGALRTSLLVQRAFPEQRVRVVSDSGPPLSSAVFPGCLQRRERELFGLDRTIFAECGEACPNPDDAWLDFVAFVAGRLSDRPLGLIQALDDWGISGFLGAGNDGCSDPDLTRTIPAAELHADLLRVRERLAATSFSTFYLDADAHTWTSGIPVPGFGDYQTARAGGVRLGDWLDQVLHAERAPSVGP